MSLPEIRKAIIDDLAAMGLGDSVTAHPGRMTIDELKTFVIKGRAGILVGCLGIPKVNDEIPEPALVLTFAVYVIALDKPGYPRDETAMTLTSAVVRRVSRNVWDRDDMNDPQDIRADNLYSGSVDKRALALWAVTWRQEWTPTAVDISSLDDLLSVVTDFDMDTDSDGEPVLTDTIELEGGS